MNNRMRMKQRAYRLTYRHSPSRTLQEIMTEFSIGFSDGLSRALEDATKAMRGLMMSATEVAKAFDWKGLAERLRI